MSRALPPLQLSIYQNANAEGWQMKEVFLIRNKEYELVMDDILQHPMKGSVQHYLLLGRRGSGKSTLLRRIREELETNKSLSGVYIPICPAEEQAGIYRLYDLLELTLQEMEDNDIKVGWPAFENDEHNYTRRLFAALHAALESSGKKIIWLLDNIDRIFVNLREGDALLREDLLNYKDIRIIGASTLMTEHFWSYNKPFYEFFRIVELPPLGNEEVRSLLLEWSHQFDIPKLAEFVSNRPGQLETIRMLTDGLPRTLLFFVNVLLSYGEGSGYEYIHRIMDEMTPLYQERINSLPPAQRKIVLQLALRWEAAGAGELAEATRMDNRVVSAQLSQLADKKIVDKIETQTKNHLYRLSERFFNLWLIFTQGGPREKRKARYLTHFLENFYSAEDLEAFAIHQLEILEGQQINADKAVVMTAALFNLKNVPDFLKENLVRKTLRLPGINSELQKMLPLTFKQMEKEIFNLIDAGQWDKAYRAITGYEELPDYWQWYFLGLLYTRKADFGKAETEFLRLQGIMPVSDNLARVYEGMNKPDLAEKFHLQSIDEGNPGGYWQLASFYERRGEKDLAIDNYLSAARHSDEVSAQGEAYLHIGLMHWNDGQLDLAQESLERAVEEESSEAVLQLASMYYSRNINKHKAIDLIEDYLAGGIDDAAARCLLFVLKLWNGDFDGLDRESFILIKSHEQLAETVLIHLMIHDQIKWVTNLFLDKEIGPHLKERFMPIYYAVEPLSGNKASRGNRMPPEISQAVEDIRRMIAARHRFYYGSG